MARKRMRWCKSVLKSILASGTPIFLLAPTSPYTLRVWKSHKSQVERQRLVLANEKRNLERYRYLLDRHVIAQQVFDAQQARVEVASVSVDDLKAKVTQQKLLFSKYQTNSM